jgi:Ca-activated chloride channel homolog
VRTLSRVPDLRGYQATTAKPTAQTSMRIGTYDDPLVSSWQVGLGKVSAWTSDAGQRWATDWTSSDEPFIATLVKDTMLNGGTGTVRTSLEGETLNIAVSGDDWPDDAEVVASVRGPNGEAAEIPLRRSPTGTFTGRTNALRAGTYAVGTVVRSDGRTVFRGGATAVRPYSAEYRPGQLDRTRLAGLSQRTGGRGVIDPVDAFDRGSLRAGQRRVALTTPLLMLALASWIAAVMLWRIRVQRRSGGRSGVTAATRATSAAKSKSAAKRAATPTATPAVQVQAEVPPTLPTPPAEPPPPSSLDQLLAKSRETRNR